MDDKILMEIMKACGISTIEGMQLANNPTIKKLINNADKVEEIIRKKYIK